MRLCAALAFVWGPLLFAQTAAPPASPTPFLTTQSTLVVVPALVRTKAGALVFTLTAKDFVLTDDGVPQKLTLDPDAGSGPLALVIAIETGGASARELDKYAALPHMLESVIGGVPHRVAVVGFDSQPTLLQDFTANTDSAAAAIGNLAPGDNGAAILDALGFSLNLLNKQPTQYRRAILLISETLDRGSEIKLDDALRTVSDTNTAIYAIGFSSGRSEARHYGRRKLPPELGGDGLPGPPHGCMGKDPNPDPDATHSKAAQAYDCLAVLLPPLALAKMAAIAATDGLQKNIPETVARLTGGEYFRLTSAKSLERDLATISNHIPNRYVLTFQPQSPHPGFHVLRLELPDYANLHATARNSYWAETAAVPSK